MQHTADKEFNRIVQVMPPSGGDAFRVLAPVFDEYGPYWSHFDGLVLPRDRIDCLTAVHRAERPGALPFPFLYASLTEDWAQSALYQRFKRP